VKDEHGYFVSGAVPEGEAGSSTNMMTRVGLRRVQKLNGPASAYEIITSADGQTWLCMHERVDNMGVGMGGRRFPTGSMEEQEERANRSAFGRLTGDQLTKLRYRETDAANKKISAINKANADYWKTGPRA
jgi:hypothetical protein